MTLEEAINYHEEAEEIKRKEVIYLKSVMESDTALKSAEECLERAAYEHKQLAEWLKELLAWRENRAAILQAGSRGEETRIYIGGRLFAVRELAQ